MKLETYSKGFGQLCHEFRSPFSGSPRQVLWVGSRPDTGGALGHRPSSFCLLLYLAEGADWNGSTGGVRLPPAACHPQSREDQRL